MLDLTVAIVNNLKWTTPHPTNLKKKILFFFFNDFYFFHDSWFTVFRQFSTVQQGDPVTHPCIHSFSQYLSNLGKAGRERYLLLSKLEPQ